MPAKIAIFASGTGTNAEKIIQHFSGSETASVALVVCNNPNAGIVEIARSNRVELLLAENEKINDGASLTAALKKREITWIVLAGFLRKIPVEVIRLYPEKIINIHPALLPKFGGKGMYGKKVHEAVLASGEKETGISVHYVTEQYDEGKIIFQAKCKIDNGETAEEIEKKVHELEYRYYAPITEKLIRQYES